jgi:hypothetical protein
VFIPTGEEVRGGGGRVGGAAAAVETVVAEPGCAGGGAWKRGAAIVLSDGLASTVTAMLRSS